MIPRNAFLATFMAAVLAVGAVIIPVQSLAAAAEARALVPDQPVSGSVSGNQRALYRFEASAGQQLLLSLHSNSPSLTFNIYREGAAQALYSAAVQGLTAAIPVAESGRFDVEIFLLRMGADTADSAAYSLTLMLDPPAADSQPAAAAVITPPYWQISRMRAGSMLNVRLGPSTQESVIGKFRKDTMLVNLGCIDQDNTAWCEVEDLAGTITGWVSRRYLAARSQAEPD